MEFEYKDLILKKKNGVDIDEEKLEELESLIYKKYIKFIRSLCFNYNQSYRDDLIQSGVIGLFKGIEKLENRDTKPLSYLVYHIKKEIQLSKRLYSGSVILPHHIFEVLNKYNLEQNNENFSEFYKNSREAKRSGVKSKTLTNMDIIVGSEYTDKCYLAKSKYELEYNRNKIWLDCELIIGKKNTQILYNRLNGMTFDAIGKHYNETAPSIGQRYRASLSKLKKSKLFAKLVECDLAWEMV